MDFLKIGEEKSESYESWLGRAQEYGKAGLQKMLVKPGSGSAGVEGDLKKFFGHVFGKNPEELLEGWQQFVVHAVDERGDPVSDYMIEVLKKNPDGTWDKFEDMYTDVHAYGPDSSFRCFYVRLPQGMSAGRIPVRVTINASTGTELMAYQGYGSEEKQLSATTEPVELGRCLSHSRRRWLKSC